LTAGRSPEREVEDWEPLLFEAQADIVRFDPHPYYIKAYRAAERDYWRHIPGWIWQDWRGRTVANCLDIGCAYGTLALFAGKATGCQTFCIDFVGTYLSKRLATERGLRFAVNNIETQAFPWPIDFDVIIFTEVLEHFNFHPVATLTKIRDLLSSDGRIYLSTPDASEWGRVTRYYRTLDEIPEADPSCAVVDDHVWQYNEDELRQVLDKAGLAIERLAYSKGAGPRHFNLTLSKT
jgi:SAM-dependent methyltransferase